MLDKTAPSALLADLKHQRASLADRMASLSDTRERVRQVEAVEAEALRAVGELSRIETAAMDAWAVRGASGPPPTIDAGRRQELAAALAVASAQATAARGAGVDVERRIVDLQREAADVGRRIAEAAIAVLLEAYDAGCAEVDRLAADLRARAAMAYGALRHAQEMAADHHQSGRTDEARAIFVAIEQRGARPFLDVAPSIGEVAAATPAWAARFDALVK